MGENTIIKRARQEATSPTYNFASIEEQARQLVETARIDASRLLEKARAEVQRLREEQRAQVADEAYELGYKEGFEKGLSEGTIQGHEAGESKALKAFHQNTDHIIDSVNAMAKEFEETRGQILEEARVDLLNVALDLSAKATSALVCRDDSLQSRTAEMVKFLTDKTSLKIFVRPSDLQQMEALLPEISATLRHNESLELIEDESLSRGAIRVVSGKSNVDSDPVAVVEAIVSQIRSQSERQQ